MKLNLGRTVTKQSGKLFVNERGFNAMKDICNKLRNIDFDSNYFIVKNYGGGILVSMSDSALTGDEEEFHFKIESNSASSALTDYYVRGGVWRHQSKNIVYNIFSTCDAGPWDENYEDTYKSITLASNAVSYIYAELDNRLLPTTVTIKSSLTKPTYDNTKDFEILGKVNTSSGVIDTQWFGGDIDRRVEQPDSNKTSPDTCSLERNNTSGVIQSYLFPAGADTAMVAGDLVEFRDLDGGIGGVPSTAYTSKVLAAGNADYATNANHAVWADVAALANVASSGWPTTFSHPSLTDLDASDDHPHYWANTSWRNPDDDSYKTTGDCFSNQFAIQENSTLNYWTNAAAKITSSDFISLVTKTNDIDITAKRNLNESAVIHSSCSTSYTILQSVGNVSSVSSSGFIKLDGDAGVIIDSDADMVLVATGDINMDGVDLDIYGSNSLKISAQGGRAILLDSDIDLQSGGELQINGAKGKTGWFDDGTNFRITVTKGLITGMANSSSAGYSTD